MTREERHLWYDYLKPLPHIFRRQRIIGNYIVDFYCPSARLVVELDGSQHFTENGHSSDERRDAYLKELGITVLRFSNQDIHVNFSGVCSCIEQFLNSKGL